jgi:hypothetical protein
MKSNKSLTQQLEQVKKEIYKIIKSNHTYDINTYMYYVDLLKALMNEAVSARQIFNIKNLYNILIMLYDHLGKKFPQGEADFEFHKVMSSLNLANDLRNREMENIVDIDDILSTIKRRLSAYDKSEIAQLIRNISWEEVPDLNQLLYLRKLRYWVVALNQLSKIIKKDLDTELTSWLEFQGKLP